MNNIKCYINDNYIDIKTNLNKYHIKSSSIKNGNINNCKLFIKDIKKQKIFNTIISCKVIIYLNKIIEEKDYIYYTYIFEQLNCNKVLLEDTTNHFEGPTLIVNDEYILFYNDKYYMFDPMYLNEYINVFNIPNLRILSNKKIKHNNKCKYYYYNSQNIVF